MHLLYLDDSGSVGNASDKHIVLAGLSVFERAPYWLAKTMDKIAGEVWPDDPLGLEFRGSDILSGRKQWRGVAKDVRQEAYIKALRALTVANGVRLFGVAVYKKAVSPNDPMEVAFEQISSRFDHMLQRLHNGGDTQRGLIVLDETSYETSLQGLSRDFRIHGHKWGSLHNLFEVPLFVDSKATRLIQYADLVAHAVRRYYEGGDATYFDVIRHSFDAEGGVLHGLLHVIPTGEKCVCPPCFQKKPPSSKRTYAKKKTAPKAAPARKAAASRTK